MPNQRPNIHSRRARSSKSSKRRSPMLLLLLLLFWSVILGWGLAQAAAPPTGTVDAVSDRYKLGQELYIETCSTCHVPLPPAVMPTQTWADILPDNQHYGAQITPLTEPSLHVVWNYVSTYSRPVTKGEATPYRLSQSRLFKALHPKVEFSTPVTLQSCATCHPNAAQFDYRTLTPQWQNSP